MYKFYLSIRVMLLLVLTASALLVSAQQFQPQINAYLQENRSKWQLSEKDIAGWTVSDQYTNRQSGITYTYLQQQVNDVRVFNAISTMTMHNQKVSWFANRFISNAGAKANAATPALTAEHAIYAAAAHLGLTVLTAPKQTAVNEERGRFYFNDCGVARKPVRAELFYVPAGEQLKLAWNIVIAPKGSADWWNIRIDAQTGAFIEKNNWTLSCDFGAGHTHTTACVSAGKTITANQPENTSGNAAGAVYNVFALPLEAASFGPRSIQTDPHSAIASPYGWHDTDGVDGAEETITKGNNVYAYEDRDNDDQPGYSPDGGAALNFDFPIDLSQSPESNQDAIITNLFYVNNMLHDILMLHGFDEEAGNFQDRNYSGNGFGNDYVLAEAQDGGGTNNANFGTPDDGESGVMQMYLWPGEAPAVMKVNAPAGIAGNYIAVLATGGTDLGTPVTGDAILADDGVDPITDACEPLLNGPDFAGKIAIIDRGTCTFVSKIAAAEDAGAIALIIINNAATAPFSVAANGAGIPTVMISMADGITLKNAIAAGGTVNITLMADGAAGADRDGSLDNGIVEHEYGHGLSNRLTGGPNNSNCLFNGEQGGEGWSDWLALILSIEPGDTGADGRGIGTYALNEPNNGGGIRRYPYSTDLAINPQTYADLSVSGEVHDIGEIWCQTLWDLTWNLINAEGFDPDWYNGNGGNHTAMRLVLEGMKMQPCGPGFLDGRDAILAADDMLYNNAHRCMIWEAFAKRGMGFNASQGSADVAGDETANFDLPPFCQTAIVPPVANFSVDKITSCFNTFVFKDLSTDIPQQWLWDFGDGTTSDDINPVHVYAIAGTYTVKLKVTNTLGFDEHTQEVTYAPLTTPAVTGQLNICAGSATTLTAAVASGNNIEWSQDGTVVSTDPVFATPVLSGTTTFSYQEFEVKPSQYVGPVNNAIGSGGNHNTGFDGRLLFEAYKPTTIVSVLVYAQGAGDRTISLYKENGSLVEEVTVNVPAGQSRITLNLDVPVAGKYALGNVSQNLYRNNSGAMYPYEIQDLVRIYQSNATTDPVSYYYYFYDWEVKEKGCSSAPAEVTVEVGGPAAAFTYLANQLNVNFTNTSAGTPGTWQWNFGDGQTSTLQNPVHTYAAEGTYTVTLTVTDGSCISTFNQVITVMTSGTQELKDAFGVNVFPNPATYIVNVAIEGALTGKINVDMFDASGKLVMSQVYGRALAQFQINTSGLPAGIYQVRVTGKEGTVVRKVTVED